MHNDTCSNKKTRKAQICKKKKNSLMMADQHTYLRAEEKTRSYNMPRFL